MLGLQSDSGAKNWTPRREMSRPVFLDRGQRQNRYMFDEQVNILDEQVDMLEIFEKHVICSERVAPNVLRCSKNTTHLIFQMF